MPKAYVKALQRHSRELESLADAQAKAYLEVLTSVQSEIRGRIAASADQGATLDGIHLRQMLAEAEIGISGLQKRAAGLWARAERESVDLAVEHLGTELDLLSRAFGAKPLNVTLDSVKVLTDPAQGLLARQFARSVEKYGNDVLNSVSQRLIVSNRVGDTVGQTVDALSAPSGPLAQMEKWDATRLVRTEVSHSYGSAQHTATKEAAKQVPELQKVWIHVSSFKCKVCMPAHGTMRKLDKTWSFKMGKKTVVKAHAPAHPNCTCRTVAMKPGWRTSMQKLGYLSQDIDDADSKPDEV